MVETKKGHVENDRRRDAVEEGLVRSISKGLYEEGVSFKINSVEFMID
jgi:hypothetical protein